MVHRTLEWWKREWRKSRIRIDRIQLGWVSLLLRWLWLRKKRKLMGSKFELEVLVKVQQQEQKGLNSILLHPFVPASTRPWS